MGSKASAGPPVAEPRRYRGMAMTGIENTPALRVSDADRNGTLRRLHNAVALGLIDIGEFEERSAQVSAARMRTELDVLVGDLPGPGAIVTSAADRVELRGWLGSLRRHGEWTVPTRLALMRAMLAFTVACRCCRRRSFTSCAVSSCRLAAGVPGRGLKMKLKELSNPTSSINFIILLNFFTTLFDFQEIIVKQSMDTCQMLNKSI